jgi:hypothetical protein
MRGDANAVPLATDGLGDVAPALRAEAHALIDGLPSKVLLAMLPVLQKYSKQGPLRGSPPGPDKKRITIHHRPG